MDEATYSLSVRVDKVGRAYCTKEDGVLAQVEDFKVIAETQTEWALCQLKVKASAPLPSPFFFSLSPSSFSQKE